MNSSRVVYGARTSLCSALGAVGLSLLLGVPLAVGKQFMLVDFDELPLVYLVENG